MYLTSLNGVGGLFESGRNALSVVIFVFVLSRRFKVSFVHSRVYTYMSCDFLVWLEVKEMASHKGRKHPIDVGLLFPQGENSRCG